MIRSAARSLFSHRFSVKRFLSNSNDFVSVKVVDRDGKVLDAKAKVGTNLLDVILDNKIDIDGFGACEGTLACSTCHVVLTEENYKTLAPAVDEENDMLDLAFGLTETSRLACQIRLEPRMKDWVFIVPKVKNRIDTKNVDLSGFFCFSGRQRSAILIPKFDPSVFSLITQRFSRFRSQRKFSRRKRFSVFENKLFSSVFFFFFLR